MTESGTLWDFVVTGLIQSFWQCLHFFKNPCLLLKYCTFLPRKSGYTVFSKNHYLSWKHFKTTTWSPRNCLLFKDWRTWHNYLPYCNHYSIVRLHFCSNKYFSEPCHLFPFWVLILLYFYFIIIWKSFIRQLFCGEIYGELTLFSVHWIFCCVYWHFCVLAVSAQWFHDYSSCCSSSQLQFLVYSSTCDDPCCSNNVWRENVCTHIFSLHLFVKHFT